MTSANYRTSTLEYHVVWGFSVRYPVAVVGLCAGLIVSSQALAAPKRGLVRKVQLISMTGTPPVEEEAVAPDSAEPLAAVDAPPLPASFAVHDLSRRYVQFRMQQEMAAAVASPAATTREPAIVAAFSSIPVPGWLRGGIGPIQQVPFKPGCAPLAYQPSGFLGRGAEARRAAYYGMMSVVACEQGIPTGLFDAMIIRESGYNPSATSRANAYGLAQLMPGTAIGLGVDRYDPVENLRGGARYLRQQLDRFGQVHLALAAYNAGPSRVRGGVVPRITETQAYVSNIIANWSRLTAPAGFPSSIYNRPIGYKRIAAMQHF